MQRMISRAPNNWFLTDRSSFLLSNQIFYNVKTVRYMQCITHNTKEGEHNDKYFMISPDWVAWLMRHPMETCNLSPSTAAGMHECSCGRLSSMSP